MLLAQKGTQKTKNNVKKKILKGSMGAASTQSVEDSFDPNRISFLNLPSVCKKFSRDLHLVYVTKHYLL